MSRLVKPRILLTGFAPFGEFGFNSSETVVRRLANWPALARKYDLIAEVLRTEYAYADARIRRLIRETQPDVCLCLGMAADSPTIRLERIAHNRDACSFPDNVSIIREGEEIVPGGPPAYESTLRCEAVRARLVRRGIPASLSRSAGSFVCNHAYYAALDEIRRQGLPTRCLFVHLPANSGRRRHGPALPLRTLIRAAKCCLEVVATFQPESGAPGRRRSGVGRRMRGA